MLSIIIPTFNEEKFLPHLLESLQKQTFNDFEIIVADNNSTDATRSIALKAGVRVVKGGLPARGRNNGAKVAQGEWLLFLDADVILPFDFLEKAMAEIYEQNVFIASCLIKPLSDRRIDKFLHNVVNLYFRATKKFFPHAPGFCIFVKKEFHQLVGGFNEKLKLAEDHDYVLRSSKIGNFDFLRGIHIPVSVRRLDKDGRFNISVKYLAAEAHLIFLGPIYSNIFNYKFGYFDEKLNNKTGFLFKDQQVLVKKLIKAINFKELKNKAKEIKNKKAKEFLNKYVLEYVVLAQGKVPFTTSFKNALVGISHVLETQPNFLFDLLIGFLVLVLARVLNVSHIELIILVLTIAMVLIAEMINTSIEVLTDLFVEDWDRKAQITKDVSAGMVLLAAVISVLIGVLIFTPYFLKFFSF